ncbi:class I SAM-dependent methyltransferase [Azospirillum griseum]|uniref:Class I SAM-dependent methyltransferase n=1 Tax=Azospirillum griseum TaxID=2496639 RepID=A0A431VGL5_9PROT|nr:class I SAM-dependent methyltransferase [Azospirillum griseum]RTR19818.1 class I SAM-dependent methyltransferase [Azospirillum griseum]
MNPDTPADDASILYYDADYPSLELGPASPDAVRALARIGLLGDVGFYAEQAAAHAAGGRPVLELGCGTGRIAIPLARRGFAVWGVEIADAMLDHLRDRLTAESADTRARLRLVRQDAAALDLPALAPPHPGAGLLLLPFNLLMLIPDRAQAVRALAAGARHLAPDGRFALDVMNPATLPQEADHAPAPSQPRRNPRTGHPYVRHAQLSAVDGRGVQRITGWYDELRPDGGIHTTRFAFDWRMIDRAELTAMLAEAGLRADAFHGDFDGAPWTDASPRIVAVGGRAGSPQQAG